MTPTIRGSFGRRFGTRVLLPGAMILLITGALCGFGMVFAGRNADMMALLGQQFEVWQVSSHGMDELAVAQESVGLCDECIRQAASARPDRDWLDRNVGFRLFDLYNAQETYIVDRDGHATYAAVGRRQADPSAYGRVAPAVDRFVKLARGQATRPMGRSNLDERLPGSPPAPMAFPPMPGFTDQPTTVYPSVRTTPSVLHATDLVRIGDRLAFVSAMQMLRVSPANPRGNAKAPVLVSLHYLDGPFLANAAKQYGLAGAHVGTALVQPGAPSATPAIRDGEASTPLMNSDGVPLATMFWKPTLSGNQVMRSLLPPAAVLFGVVTLMVLLMSLKLRGAMKREDERIAELECAHLELKAKEAQAHHLAYHDVLTGLANRALFNDRADQALLRARHGEAMAILLLDLDRFKNVNDRLGHLAGDELIQQVGKRLSRVLKGNEMVARLGGDEFAILLQGETFAADLEATLELILEDLHRPYEIQGNQAHVGVSIGVARAPECGTDRTDLMRKADIALYRAKDEGRDCYRFFTDEMDETVQLRTSLEADLRAALATGEGLGVHYQPLVDSAGRKITGLEALVRWEHPTRGSVPPSLFVPVAEETGLIAALGDWVMGEACKVAREWPNLSISINLSPIQFCDEGFAERLCGIVRDARVSPHQIELEVTEGVVLDQNETVRGALRRLRSEGFRIALDDFGTGYSSLSYLRDFEVDRIKIDKSFVQSLGLTLDAGAIVTAVVTLGHAMGLQVTAEGVETADQESFLRSAGCNVLQGFLFSKAVPANELAGSLARHKRSLAA
jgi:diguanylate cyclase (GGDEF)-like protein